MADVVSTGIEALDERTGGLPAGTLTQVYGPAGSGKSSLALTLARAATPSCLILAERLHRRRVADVIEPAAERVLVARPRDLEAQQEALERSCGLLASGRARSVVLDSLTFLYRFTQGASTDALSQLFDQLGRLHTAARDGNGIALVTNQVKGEAAPRPIGGPGVRHVSDVLIRLDDAEGAWRRLHLEKHPYEPGFSVDVKITSSGMR